MDRAPGFGFGQRPEDPIEPIRQDIIGDIIITIIGITIIGLIAEDIIIIEDKLNFILLFTSRNTKKSLPEFEDFKWNLFFVKNDEDETLRV